ncbi:hypothetical protein [Mycoplasma miroungirhinis]|uniref:1-phosphatidylinositol phosphodiesterase n=1 Tax=Mycoplasma miroungirhinis TaxID=754516 RepID=A0A6M4JI97_9MOLU|nr:hypothetical protein [Mycoplasma miroungirhinis]QJR44191.1 hypothetical protein HLA92_01965 [Mycoplasma miroungirhinis]
MSKKLLFVSASTFIPVVSLIAMSLNNSIDKNVHKDNNLAYVWDNKDIKDRFNRVLAENWMSEIKDDRSLFSLSIPGTHDSAMWNGRGIAYTFGSQYARTQAYNFNDQLRLGIRAFDLRMTSDGWLKHGSTYSQSTFNSAMNEITKYLEKHKTEFVVIRIKDENFDVNSRYDANNASRIYNNVLDKYNKYLYNPQGKSLFEIQDQNGFNIGQYRGKVIILNHWHHKVNQSRKGGFLYRELVYKNYTEQDKYDGVDPSSKLQLVKDLINSANNRPYSEQNLYVNFVSFASGWRPLSSAYKMNGPLNDWLNKNEKLSTLGVIYTDFPGPALIQSIYRTNFYYSDEYLDSEGIGKNVLKLKLQDVFEEDNELIFKTDDWQRYKNTNIEVYLNNQKIQTKYLDDNYNSLTFKITLNQTLHKNDNLVIKSYKLTPNNGWYQQRKYNQKELRNIDILDNLILLKKRRLIDEITQIKQLFTQKYPKISNYIDLKYINEINKISTKNPDSNTILNSYETKWNNIKTNLNDFYNYLNDLELKQNVFNRLNTKIFNSQNLDKLNKYNNIQTQINSLFNENQDLTSFNLSNLINSILKNTKILKHLTNLVNNFNSKNIHQTKDDFNNFETAINFAKEYWNNQLLKVINQPNDILSQLENINNLDNLETKAYELIQSFNTEITTLKTQIEAAKNNILILNNYFVNNDNKDLKQMFLSDITNSIKNLENPKILIDKINVFKEKLNTLKTLVLNSEQFKTDNHFLDFLSHDKELYTQTINKLKVDLNNFNSDIYNFQTIDNKISNLRNLEKNISLLNTKYQQLALKIKNSDKLFAEQKNLLLDSIKKSNSVTYNTIENLNNLVDSFIRNNYESRINSFINLNDAQKHNTLNKIKNIINLNEIDNEISVMSILNNNMQILKNVYNLFNNYQNTNGYIVLENNQKQELDTWYNKAQNNLNININNNQVLEIINHLEKYKTIFDNKTIDELKQKITENELLYNFQKNQLNEQLNIATSKQDVINVENELDQLKNFNLISKDKNSFNNLSSNQKTYILNQLRNSQTQDIYNKNKNIFNNLLNAINIAKNLYEINKNVISTEKYINNTAKMQHNFQTNLNKLSNIYQNSLSLGEINNEMQDFHNFLSDFENSHILFNENEHKKRLILEYEQIVKTLNDKKITYDNSQHAYDNLISNIENSIKVNNLVVYEENATIKTIENSKNHLLELLNKLQISEEEINKHLEEENQSLLSIIKQQIKQQKEAIQSDFRHKLFINIVNNYNQFLNTKLNNLQQNNNNFQTLKSLLSDINKQYEQFKINIQNKIDTELNKLIKEIKFSVLNNKTLDEITISDLKIIKDTNINVKIMSIYPDFNKKTLLVNFEAQLFNKKQSSNSTISQLKIKVPIIKKKFPQENIFKNINVKDINLNGLNEKEKIKNFILTKIKDIVKNYQYEKDYKIQNLDDVAKELLKSFKNKDITNKVTLTLINLNNKNDKLNINLLNYKINNPTKISKNIIILISVLVPSLVILILLILTKFKILKKRNK